MIELHENEALSFEPPIKLIFLSGGIKCLNGGNGLCILSSPGGDGTVWSDFQRSFYPDGLMRLHPIRPLIYSISYNTESLNLAYPLNPYTY
jgi:hypothetical protein